MAFAGRSATRTSASHDRTRATFEVSGTTCEHYAFRQDDVDWQVWIQKGDYPLPRKLVITTTTEAGRPQHTATYTWNLAPSFNEASFTFVPPAGARKIVLSAVGEPQGGK